MRHHRFLEQVEPRMQPLPSPETSPQGFMLVPAHCLPQQTADESLQQQQVYQRAMEEARAVVRPSIVERDLLGVWN